ncbi:hypothetical protein HRW16_07155 [Streptomyces lunaelactis]|uniref:hypothetical protein n=1 Tax=Streptomyces lunaelactis TaxID=1535768 RepID=UPI001585C064|nr:hypothetical protein [Streptomyces lunaelactis]NUK01728.1 hypothetical protein [Streptomyces lunaelactis]NUK34571.1 hypothetical protein [Streptomyces lunaelactis]NUK42226.1 hypothetical protein [Streptomyces lunaelactis]NUK91651.1 hypothetical protein [Streptomyces lunaelactis]NUL31113.1 hypothetical protein [Streptomyces lunaelactis]
MWGAKDLIGIRLKPEDVPFATPVEAWNCRVGQGFIEWLSERLGGQFQRNAADVGLVSDFTILNGPEFDSSKVDPLIREFYEHTMRFELAVHPHWNPWFRPPFWLFRRLFAERIDQFNLPFDNQEAKQGVKTRIETIDIDHDKIVDIRGWIRTYAESQRVIYVGLYSAVRLDGMGYVSVVFPMPNSNITATLVPANLGTHDFILKTHDPNARFAGDYIVMADEESGTLDVFRMRFLREEISVYVREEELFADHSFYFDRIRFLTLKYTITRRRMPVPLGDISVLLEAEDVKVRSDTAYP